MQQLREVISALTKYRLLIGVVLFAGLAATVLAFSNHWSTQFNSSNDLFGLWRQYMVGACGGQNHSVSGGLAHLAASYGTDCFGAFYRDSYNGSPNTFPTDQDVRVMWRWRYPAWGKYGTQAGQITSAFGVTQYYGVSAVDTGNGDTDYAHVESDGDWGHWDVDHPMWRSSSRDTGWHISTFDYLCDGQVMDWWVDGNKFHHVGNGTVRPAGDSWRPAQFWFGNLITSVPGSGGWTNHDLDYVYIYAVERPQMTTPSPGGGGTQTVSWQAVSNTPQPDGSSWNIEYQVIVCTNPGCGTVVDTSPWLSGTSHTFTGLPLQATYYYRARARWVGTPELITCWGNTVQAEMTGEPNLVLAKSATIEQEPGEVVQYSLIVQNSGDAPASGVVVRDPIPSSIVEPGSISGGGSVQAAEVVWNLGVLNAGESRTLTWQGRIDANIPPSVAQVVNIATASDSSGRTAQAQAATQVIRPGLQLVKSATTQVWPGGQVEYEITVQSIGQATLRNLLIRDPLPAYVLNPTAVSHGGQLQGADLVWSLDPLAPGATVVLTWRGAVDPAIPSNQAELVNQVTGSASGGVNDTAEATSLVLFPNLGLGKTGPGEAAPGDLIQYTLVVQNNGPAPAYGVTVTDPIPAYIVNPGAISGGGQVIGADIVWHLGTLNGGESRTLLWQGSIDLATPLTKDAIDNEARACDAAGRCNTTVFRTRLLKPAARLIKNAEPYGWPGKDINYTIIVENTGETVLTDVVVRDPLPEYILYPRQISHGGQAVEYPFEGKIETTWYLGDLAPGQRVELAWLGTADPQIPIKEYAIRNQAFLATAQGLTRQAEGSTYILHPDVRLHKSATLEAGLGQRVDYTLTVENPSWAPAYQVEIHDPIPPYILDAAGASGGGEIRADEIVWQIAELAPGEVRVLSWYGLVDPNIPTTETQIVNTATVMDMTGQSDEAEAVTNLPAQQLYLAKAASYLVYPGGEVVYTVTIRSRSDVTLYNLDIRDPVPDYVLNPTNISHGGIYEGNLDIFWEINALAPGQVLELTWRGTLDPRLPREQRRLWNEVTLTSDSGLEATAKAKSFIEYPALVLAKQATSQAGPGEVVSYTLTVENAGLVPALGVEIHDPLPAYLVDPTDISSGGVSETLPVDEIFWELDTLAPGERRTLGWSGTVALDIPLAQDQLVNTATATESSGTSSSAQATTQVLRPDIELEKQGPVEVGPGEPVRYTLTVTNSGQMTLRQVVVSDPIPAFITPPLDLSGGGTVNTNEISWQLGELAPGEVVQLSWAGTVDPDIPIGLASLSNRASVTAWPGVEADTATTSQVLQPELEVTKQATGQVSPGDLVDYRIELVNQGRITIHQLQVEDPLPLYLTVHSVNDGGYEVPGRIVWENLGDLQPGDSRILTWQARVAANIPPEVDLITNVVRVSALGGLDLEAQAASTLLQPGLVMVKMASASAHAGGEIGYRLRLINNGPGPERQLEVRDPLPAYVAYVPDSATGYGQLADGEVSWHIDQLGPGQSLELRWRGQVAIDLPPAVSTITNEARVWSLDTPVPLTATATTSLLAPGVTLQLLCPPTAQAGDVLSYTIRLHNAAAGTLVEPLVRLPLPPGATYIPGTASHNGQLQTGLTDEWGQPRPDELLWRLDTLAAGERKQLSLALAVSPVLTGQVTSTVTIYTHDEAVTEVGCQSGLLVPALQVTKSGPDRATVNDIAAFEITVANIGPVVAHQTRLTDTLPPGIDYLPGSASDEAEVITRQASDEDAALPVTSITWDLSDLAPGEQVIRRFRGQIHMPLGVEGYWQEYSAEGEAELYNIAAATAERTNQAWATSLTLVPRPALTLTRQAVVEAGAGNTAVYTLVDNTAIGPAPALALSSDSPTLVRAAAARPGDVITHTLTGGNVGPGPARQAVLRDRVPPDLIVLEDTIGQGGYYDQAGQAVVWPLGDLTQGATVQRSYALLAPVALRPGLQQLDDNRGLLTSADAPTVYANASTEISGTFTMAGQKQATSYVEPGGQIDYSIRIQNTSPNVVGNVIIRDPLPLHTHYLTGTASLPPILADGGQTLSWQLGLLAAGEVREVRFSTQVAASLPDWYDQVVNQAEIGFSDGSFSLRAVTRLPSRELTPEVAPTTRPPASEPGEPPAPPAAGPPTVTPVPPRPPVVDGGPVLTPTVGPAPTPLPAPGLRKAVSAEQVNSGEVTPLTWRLTFSNPTPLTVGSLVIRDVLPAGLLYVDGQSSRGRLEISPRSAAGETRLVETVSLTATSLVTPTAPITAGGVLPQALAGTADVPLTEVVAYVDEVPPGGRVEIIINTLVLSDALPGAIYTNVATYTAANLDPGQSNEASVVVRSRLSLLPVTGGLLDPRTPQGQLTWSGSALLLWVSVVMWRRHRQRRRTEVEQ